MRPNFIDKFVRLVWDSETKTLLGRNKKSWAKILAFYIALYSCLAVIWSFYFYIFHLTISDKHPKWQLQESLIGTNPGLGLKPMSPHHKIESALISFSLGTEGNFKHWVDDINAYLEQMEQLKNNSTAKQDCNSNKDPEAYCPFDNSSIPTECTAAQNYSFPIGKPCILIKLNRIYGWRPEPYETKPEHYPKDAPFSPGNIQITCDGQHDADKEHIGPIDYYPNGIETKYYPFLNQAGYQSPYVMVHFKEPKLDTLIYVECRAWAKNIQQDKYDREGMTTFELFIEHKTAHQAPLKGWLW